MKINRIISVLSILLVAMLAVAAFTLSYSALRELASKNGIPQRLAWLWPLVVDGFLMVATLSVLRNSLNGDKAIYQWSLVALFTMASIAFNVVHANGSALSIAVGAVPPIALALALELAMGQLKSDVRRRETQASLAELENAIAEAQGELEELGRERQDRLAELDNQLEEKRKDRLAESTPKVAEHLELGQIRDKLAQANLTRSEKSELATQAVLKIYARNPEFTQAEVARHVGRSASWVSRTLSELEERGRVERNGNGVEVLQLQKT